MWAPLCEVRSARMNDGTWLLPSNTTLETYLCGRGEVRAKVRYDRAGDGEEGDGVDDHRRRCLAQHLIYVCTSDSGWKRSVIDRTGCWRENF